jgi:DNA-binding MarR family transcriptional regulator
MDVCSARIVGTTNDWYDCRVPMPHPVAVNAPARLRDRPSWLISRAYVRSTTLLAAAFEESGEGLRSYHFRLLAALDEWGPASQADLGRSTGIDRSDVTAALTELEARNLIERAVDPDHKRRNVVSLTALGAEQLASLDQVVTRVQTDLLASLTSAQKKQFVSLLHHLLE